MRKELSLVWVWSYAMWGTSAEYAIVLDMLAAGRLQARPMITHHYPLAEIGAAFAAADDKGESDAIKVVVAP
jgi:threonine dehydrogenase-like Zn-dependent dehydrogenase